MNLDPLRLLNQSHNLYNMRQGLLSSTVKRSLGYTLITPINAVYHLELSDAIYIIDSILIYPNITIAIMDIKEHDIYYVINDDVLSLKFQEHITPNFNPP